MKKTIIILACAAALHTGCMTTKDAAQVSWEAFCIERGHDINDNSEEVYNEYLDTWRGSAAEEKAFDKAGVEPY